MVVAQHPSKESAKEKCNSLAVVININPVPGGVAYQSIYYEYILQLACNTQRLKQITRLSQVIFENIKIY